MVSHHRSKGDLRALHERCRTAGCRLRATGCLARVARKRKWSRTTEAKATCASCTSASALVMSSVGGSDSNPPLSAGGRVGHFQGQVGRAGLTVQGRARRGLRRRAASLSGAHTRRGAPPRPPVTTPQGHHPGDTLGVPPPGTLPQGHPRDTPDTLGTPWGLPGDPPSEAHCRDPPGHPGAHLTT